MRLVNKKTLEIEFFLEGKAPPYVILSHRWVGNETALQEFVVQSKQDERTWSYGTRKVIRLCKEVADREEDYVWVDTCCIDKTSSTELQEAINSMYKWYEQAALCMVFMDDVEFKSDASEMERQIIESRWFTRGWTLQELLAPKNQLFVNCNWKPIGTRSELAGTIESVSGIAGRFMGDPKAIRSATVAQRMSWLARRETTRVEDLAYCMLGIFNVNMTMLYGEGTKAFVRLQKELLQTIDDESIFLWASPAGGADLSDSTILAPSPACFAGESQPIAELDLYFSRDPLRVTAAGLEVELYKKRKDEVGPVTYEVPLNCTINGKRACLHLQKEPATRRNQWKRIDHQEIYTTREHFPVPLSDRERYDRQQRQKTIIRLGRQAVDEFGEEPIKFKVFVI